MSLVRPEDWKPQGVEDLERRAWEALRQTDNSVIVIAGAGAGKTEFLAQKAAYLLQTGLCPAPKRILAISFKRDAARNLAERVAKRCLPEQARRFGSYTFDAFAKSLVDRFRAAIPTPYCPSADYRIMFPFRPDYDTFRDAYGFYDIDSGQLERGIATERLPVPADGSRLQQAVAIYWRAQYHNQDGGALSFPMINRLAELLLRHNPPILKALHLTYPIVFLDEFQDTTFSQFQLLCTAFKPGRTVFTAVGDDKQQIMGWAGAMPDAFDKFEDHFSARRVSLSCNWRTHDELVRIQHLIATLNDSLAERQEARADRIVAGDIAAIWEFDTENNESECLAAWIKDEVQSGHVKPHDFAILVRSLVGNAESKLGSSFHKRGLRLRNVARNVGDIAIQDLLGEELTQILLRLLRLGSTIRSPENWNTALLDLQYLEGMDPADEMGQQKLQERLQKFVRKIRIILRELDPSPQSATKVAEAALNFIGKDVLCAAFPSYQRQSDFDRVWNGFALLLQESLQHATSWSNALDDFEGLGQIALMTIHKSKGLEFHTMVFYGLDNQTWWSLTRDSREEVNSFFVALTRAKQRAFFTLCKERGRPIEWLERILIAGGVLKTSGIPSEPGYSG